MLSLPYCRLHFSKSSPRGHAPQPVDNINGGGPYQGSLHWSGPYSHHQLLHRDDPPLA